MQIDDELLNKILNELAGEYPGTMSQEAFDRICDGQTDGQKVAGHFQFLEEQGYIETQVYVDYDDNPRTYQVNIHKTKILSTGIQLVNKGGL